MHISLAGYVIQIVHPPGLPFKTPDPPLSKPLRGQSSSE